MASIAVLKRHLLGAFPLHHPQPNKANQLSKVKILLSLAKSYKGTKVMYGDMRDVLADANAILKDLSNVPELSVIKLHIQVLQSLAWYYHEVEIDLDRFDSLCQEALVLFQLYYREDDPEDQMQGSGLDVMEDEFDYFHGRKASTGLTSLVAPGMSMVPRKKKKSKIGLNLKAMGGKSASTANAVTKKPPKRRLLDKARTPILNQSDFHQEGDSDDDDGKDDAENRRIKNNVNLGRSGGASEEKGKRMAPLVANANDVRVTNRITDRMLARSSAGSKVSSRKIVSSSDTEAYERRTVVSAQGSRAAPQPFLDDFSEDGEEQADDEDDSCNDFIVADDDFFDNGGDLEPVGNGGGPVRKGGIVICSSSQPVVVEVAASSSPPFDPRKETTVMMVMSSPQQQQQTTTSISTSAYPRRSPSFKKTKIDPTTISDSGNFVQIAIEDEKCPFRSTLILRAREEGSRLSLLSTDIHDYIKVLSRSLGSQLKSFRSSNGFVISSTSQDTIFSDVDGNVYLTALLDQHESVGDYYRCFCKNQGVKEDRRLTEQLSRIRYEERAATEVVSFENKSLSCSLWQAMTMLQVLSPRIVNLSSNRLCDWEDGGRLNCFPGGALSDVLRESYQPPSTPFETSFDNLAVLNLSRNRLSSLSITPLLSKLLSSPGCRLESLDLSYNQLDNTVLAPLSEVMCKESMRELYLSGNEWITFSGVGTSSRLIQAFRMCRNVNSIRKLFTFFKL